MAESPTPETGTPESQSPARTPPVLITTEELLQTMVSKSPEAGVSSAEVSPGGSVWRRGLAGRYERLKVADSEHKLHGLVLPPEEELRAAALWGRPAVGPPPRLPHQLNPALQAVLLGWRSLYESCGAATVLQTLVGDYYAPEAVFEDALVSARGQEAIFRQFAMLGAAVRAVQVGAYSLSVAPLSGPPVLAWVGGAKPKADQLTPQPSQPPQSLRGSPRQRARTRPRTGYGVVAAAERPAAAAVQPTPLHLTRVAVENVQCFTVGLPPWLAWLAGGKGFGLQIHLYVTSILLVASDAPLAVGLEGAASDVTASRLAGAAVALGGYAAAAAAPPPPAYGGVGGGGDDGDGGTATPNWRIVHQVDLWHNVPMVWWRLRRALCVAIDAVLSPLLGI